MKERTIKAWSYVGQALKDYEFSHEYYAHDAGSRLKSIERQTRWSMVSSVDRRIDGFYYNDANELVDARYDYEWSYTENNWSGFHSQDTYDLDKAGNRLTLNGANTTPNNLNQYAQTPGGPEHEIRTYGNVEYAYLGDTRLARATKPNISGGQDTYELGYDALGRTVRRKENGVAKYYIFDGEHAIIERDQAGTMLSSNLYGRGVDEILMRGVGGVAQYFHQDYLGNTTAVSDSSGQIKEQYRYKAFGLPEFHGPPGPPDPATNPYGARGPLLASSSTLINNRFLFTGREWAPKNFGFYEYRARAYHPGLGRFMSEDPLGIKVKGAKPSSGSMPNIAPGQLPQGFAASESNLFTYCENDPVKLTDAMGLYVTYPREWSDADAQKFKAVFDREWNSQEGRAKWEKRYASEHEFAVTPDRGSGTPEEGANNFRITEYGPATFWRQVAQVMGVGPKEPSNEYSPTKPIRDILKGDLPRSEVASEELKQAADYYRKIAETTKGTHAESAASYNRWRANYLESGGMPPPKNLPEFMQLQGLTGP